MWQYIKGFLIDLWALHLMFLLWVGAGIYLNFSDELCIKICSLLIIIFANFLEGFMFATYIDLELD